MDILANTWRIAGMRALAGVTLLPALLAHLTIAAESPAFMTGVDANYAPEMAARGAVWKVAGETVDLFAALHAAGVDSFRVRVWTVATGPGSADDAVAVAKRAQAAGMRPYLVFFLSENWSDYVKQPAPAAWASLSFPEKLAQVTAYSEQTTRRFQQAGIATDLYEVGNEIDFGICGEFEERWENRFNLAYMSERIWGRAAQVIRAAEEGIRRANPKARFVLHLTQWWNPEFCAAFHAAMIRNGAHVDLLGLSFFPSSGLSEKQTFADLGTSVQSVVAATGAAIVICECGYPSQPSFGGQFSTWNKAVPGYPLSPAGQRQWLADALAFCRGQSQIRGVFYWSPEWYTEEMWQAFALFGADGAAREALGALRGPTPTAGP